MIVAVTLAAHSSSLRNEYAFDDELIILRNVPVQRGISGVGELLTTDVFASYMESVGGESLAANMHYRPLSVITFAIEQSLFGRTLGDDVRALRAEWSSPSTATRPVGEIETRLQDMQTEVEKANREIAFHRHLVQVLLYAACAVVLLWFLRVAVLPAFPLAAFIAAVLFALHPVHTEVVANIKSRDEILSLLFILLAAVFLFEWDRARKPLTMGLALVSFGLALLAKEYAAVVPVILAGGLMLLRRRTVRQAAMTVAPLLAVLGGYMLVRQSIVGGASKGDVSTRDILIDPFLKLRTGEAEGSVLATKIDLVDHYLRLLVFPDRFSSDYSYAAFSYSGFTSPGFLLSLLVHGVLIALTVFAWRRRHVMAFAGIVYFGFLALVQLGATLGERLIFHSSVGFALLLGWAIAKLPRVAALAVCVAIAIPYGVVSFARDRDWKDNRTLFLTDVRTQPGSILLNGNAGQQLVNEGLGRMAERKRSGSQPTPADRAFVRSRTAEGLVFLRRAVQIHDGHAPAWTNIGIAHYFREEWAESGKAFARAAELRPDQPVLRQYAANFHLLATTLARSGQLSAATDMFGYAAATAPNDVRYQLEYGTAAFMELRFADARKAFERALAVDSRNPAALRGHSAASALERLTNATVERPDDPLAFSRLAAALDATPHPRFAEAAARARAASDRLRAPQ